MQIPLTYTDPEVAAIFPPDRYTIQSIRLLNEGDRPHHRAVGTRFRGAGFVRLATREEAEAAVAELNGKLLPGHTRLRNGHFETLQVRFADTEAQKLVKASVKSEGKGKQPLPSVSVEDRVAILPSVELVAKSPTNAPPLPISDHCTRHISTHSEISMLSSSTSPSTASSSPVLSILPSDRLHQAPWAASIPLHSQYSPITPFEALVQQQPPVQNDYSFPPISSSAPLSQASGALVRAACNSHAPIPSQLQLPQPSSGANLPPLPAMPPQASLLTNMVLASTNMETLVPDFVPSIPNAAPAAISALPLAPLTPAALNLADLSRGITDPILASLLASAFQQGQISAQMQALSADIEQRRQSLEARFGGMNLAPPLPEPYVDAGRMSTSNLGGHPSLGDMPSGLPANLRSLIDDRPAIYLAGSQCQPVPVDTSVIGPDTHLSNPASGLIFHSPAGVHDAGYENNAASRRGSLSIEEDFPDPIPTDTRQPLLGLGMSGLSSDLKLAQSTIPAPVTRPRANTANASHAPAFELPRKESLLAPDSALARRSSAIENRLMCNEGRGEVLNPATIPTSRLRSRNSVVFSEMPMHVTGMQTPDKAILTQSRAVRSHSAFGLRESVAERGLSDSGYGLPMSGRKTSIAESQGTSAGAKYVIPSRRSSHIGIVSGAAESTMSRPPGLSRVLSRPSLQNTLRESFSTMSLQNGSTKEEREDLDDGEIEEENLTQISPMYTFGTSYTSSSESTFESQPSNLAFGRRYHSASIANPGPYAHGHLFDTTDSDASSASQDVTEQYALDAQKSQERRGSRDEIKDGEMTESERFLRSLLNQSMYRKTSLPIGL